MDFEINKNDQRILRELALRVAEIAKRPEQNEKRELWRKHNALESTRPLILCSPENAWFEIIPENDLVCQSKLARDWEFRLRQEIFWGDNMGDDYVVEPHFDIAHIFSSTG